MPKLLKRLKQTVDVTIPEMEELTHGQHPKIDYWLLGFDYIF